MSQVIPKLQTNATLRSPSVPDGLNWNIIAKQALHRPAWNATNARSRDRQPQVPKRINLLSDCNQPKSNFRSIEICLATDSAVAWLATLTRYRHQIGLSLVQYFRKQARLMIVD
jgi:hypothetical protein